MIKKVEDMTQIQVAQYIIDEFKEHKLSGKVKEIIQIGNLEHKIILDTGEWVKVTGLFSFYLKRFKK